MNLSRQQLYAALLDAFPGKADLDTMLFVGLGQNPDVVAPGSALPGALVKLLQWAESHDHVRDLVVAAHSAVPTNPALKACLDVLDAASSASPSVAPITSPSPPPSAHTTFPSSNQPAGVDERLKIHSQSLPEVLMSDERVQERTSSQERTKVFISYCHADEAALKRLHVHLKQMEREGLVERWDDTRINSGQKWKAEIEQALATTKVAVLLISADFLASNFIASDELPTLLAAAEAEGVTLLSVILKPCRFTRNSKLAAFQAVNDPNKPVIDMTEADQERLWVRLTEAIEAALHPF